MTEPIEVIVERLFEGKTSTIAKDLKLDLKKYMSDASLAPEEAYPALLALATLPDWPQSLVD